MRALRRRPLQGRLAVNAALVLCLACSSPESGAERATQQSEHPPFPRDARRVDWFVEAPQRALPIDEANGLTLADLDADGDRDLLVSTRDGRVLVLQNGSAESGAPAFEPWSELSGVTEVQGLAIGHVRDPVLLDLALASERGLRLFQQVSGAEFVDVTESAGIHGTTTTQGVALGDWDTDGLTDLYAVGYSLDGSAENQLWLNRGDGRFEPADAAFGLSDRAASWVAASADLDADGDVDVFVGNDAFEIDLGAESTSAADGLALPGDALYENLGFLEAARAPTFRQKLDAVASARRSTMGVLVSDFSGDDHADLFLSDFGANDLLVGDGSGGFLDRTLEAELGVAVRDDDACSPPEDVARCALVSWGAAHADFDLDGIRDLVVVRGATMPGQEAPQPASLWRGTEQGAFEALASAVGWTPGRGLLVDDVDGDADLDLVIANRERGQPVVRVFENRQSAPARLVRVELRGSTSNFDGLGARVALRYDAASDRRWVGHGGLVYSWAGAEEAFPTAGREPRALEVRWPSGLTQELAPSDAERWVAEEPEILRVSRRFAPADGRSRIDVEVRLADALGERALDAEVELRCSGCVWEAELTRDADGSYRRSLVAPNEPTSVRVSAAIDGTPLAIQPCLRFE